MYHYQRFCSFRASSHIAMYTQGVASLALGYVLHWAFSPPLLNPKLESLTTILKCRHLFD